MPIYKKDITRTINQTDMKLLMEKMSLEHKAATILLYLTGARPSEILLLKPEDFSVQVNGDLQITLTTLKHGVPLRTLVFAPTTPFIDILLQWVNGRKGQPKLFTFTCRDTLQSMLERYSAGTIAPYTFRHNRLTQLALKGADAWQLLSFKGGKSINSVAPYVARGTAMNSRLKNSIE